MTRSSRDCGSQAADSGRGNPSVQLLASHAVIILLFCSCASTSTPTVQFDAATGQTRYASNKVLVGNVGMSSGLTSGQRVMLQAFASCVGRSCVPSEVAVAFFNDSSADLNLDYRRVAMQFAGRSLEWEDEGRIDESPNRFVPRGEFIRVPLNASDFERLAQAQEVRVSFGLTGTTQFRVPRERREPLLELVEVWESGIDPIQKD